MEISTFPLTFKRIFVILLLWQTEINIVHVAIVLNRKDILAKTKVKRMGFLHGANYARIERH